MRWLPVLLAFVVLLAPAVDAHAQPCRIAIDVQARVVSSAAKTTCYDTRKIVFDARNSDDVVYRVEVKHFRFDSAAPDVCNPTGVADSPFLEKDKILKIRLRRLGSNSSDPKTAKLKVARRDECYKFDIFVYDESGKEVDKLDPDLQVTPPPTVTKPPNSSSDGVTRLR